MSKINGVEIKNLKSFVGHEGIAFQGDVWLNKKKLGFWSQDGNGAVIDDYYFDEHLLDEACKNFKDGFPDDFKYKEYADSHEVFLDKLAMMKLIEKEIKKGFRIGYKTVVFVTDGTHQMFLWLTDDAHDEELLEKHKNDVQEMKQEMYKNSDPAVHIFRPGGFDFIVDSTHPAPGILY